MKRIIVIATFALASIFAYAQPTKVGNAVNIFLNAVEKNPNDISAALKNLDFKGTFKYKDEDSEKRIDISRYTFGVPDSFMKVKGNPNAKVYHFEVFVIPNAMNKYFFFFIDETFSDTERVNINARMERLSEKGKVIVFEKNIYATSKDFEPYAMSMMRENR